MPQESQGKPQEQLLAQQLRKAKSQGLLKAFEAELQDLALKDAEVPAASTATQQHSSSTSGAKDFRLENMFQEACANAPPKIRCLLQEVSALGHYPKRYKQPQNKEERDSNSLAKKLTQARSSFNPAAQKYLEAMQAAREAMQAAKAAREHAQQAEALMQ